MPVINSVGAGNNDIVEIQTYGIVAAGDIRARPSIIVSTWRRTSVLNPFVKTTVETAYQAAIGVPLIAALNNRFVQSYNLVRAVTDAEMPNTQVTRAVVGGVAGDAMPSINAAYILLRTAIRGKGLKGSKHLWPMSESATTPANGDIFNAGYLTTLGVFVAAFLAGFTDGSGNVWVPTIVRRGRFSQLKKNPTTVTYVDIASAVINKRVAEMNRRYMPSEY